MRDKYQNVNRLYLGRSIDMNIEMLLKEIKLVSDKYDSIYKKTGAYFNIFDIANIGSDEVKICRVVHELINPKGRHFQDDAYLRLFVEHVLKLDFSEEEFRTAIALREYPIDQDRRIDLVIKTNRRFIPIEVKIYATDQIDQCYDYYKKAVNSNLYYLTLDGHEPETMSAKRLGKDSSGYKGINLISFQNEVLLWLQKCLEHHETIKVAPIREILIQLIAVIRKMTNQMGESKDMEIVKILASTKDNIKSALEIERSLKNCKIGMMKKVLSELDSRIEAKLDKKKLTNQYDYEFDGFKLVESYYDKKSPTWPGISYKCKTLSKTDVELWFRIEIGYNIYAGYITPKNGVYNGNQVTGEELQGILSEYDIDKNGWWVLGEDLPVDDSAQSPDFKTFNDAYLNLFDEEGFKKFIDKSIENIENLLSKLE